jgi:hypothetical protein
LEAEVGLESSVRCEGAGTMLGVVASRTEALVEMLEVREAREM